VAAWATAGTRRRWNPLASVRSAAARRMAAWVRRRQGADTLPVVLQRRRLYILPSRSGVALGALLFLMLLAGLNYANSLALFLTFLLVAFCLVVMQQCHRNLQGLAVEALHAPAVFARRPGAGSGRAAPTLRAASAQQLERTLDAPAGTPLARLLVMSRGRTVSERGLYPGRLIIGRASDADLRVESPVVSRHHCQIVTSERLCLLEDLNSSNGVYVKNQRVRRHNLNDGDVVSLGSHQLMYIDERPGTRVGAEGDSASTGSQPRLAPLGEATQT
jgi:hypothetical protein